jgi:acetolactate synthase regulatory subunit
MSLKVSMRGAVGALTRVLGVVERRGFEAVSVSAIAGGGGRRIDLYMTVRGERSFEQLVRQIAKSCDVLDLEVLR